MPRALASHRPTGTKKTAPRMTLGEVKERPASNHHGTLVRDLALRLRQSPDLPGPPLVVLNRIAQTRSIHVMVIWDKWKSVTIPQRGLVITDAFAAAFPNEEAVVRLPIGLTPGEAFAQGYLPYQITPLVRPTDGVSATAVKQAMNSAGGVRMQVGGDMRLRFATRGQASEAYRRLVERVNKPIWTLSEETSSSNADD